MTRTVDPVESAQGELDLLPFQDGGIRREYAEIGLSPKAGWYSAIFINLLGGLLLVGFVVFAPRSGPPELGWFTLFVLLNAAAAAIGLRLVGDADWGLYFRVAQSWLVYVGFAVVMGQGRIAFIWIPMLAMASVTSMYGVRRGVPFVVGAIALSVTTALVTGVAGHVALAAVMGFALLIVGVALLLVQHHVRGLATDNRRLAETDELTGIANMRSLRRRLAAELNPIGENSARPFALFAIDLDEFKRVNDEFDHGTGDRLLWTVARELGAEARPVDLVARRGGDEFSMLVPDAGHRDLDDLAARLDAAIRRARLAVCPDVTPSGSVGYTLCHPGEQIPDVLARADDALHHAKLDFRKATGAQAARRLPRSDGFVPSSGSTTAAMSHVSQRGRDIRLVWGLALILYGPLAALMFVFAAFAPRANGVYSALAAGVLFTAIAAWCLRSRLRASRAGALKPVFVVSIAAIVPMIAASGDLRLATINLLPMMAIYAFILFEARLAGAIALLSLAAYLPLLMAAGVKYTTITAVSVWFVVTSSSTIVAKVRSVTKRFIRANVALSEHDALTGVANLRALRARLGNAVEMSLEEGHALSLIAFDLDDFKAVNERYSHTVGDSVLVAAARALDDATRIDDVIARRGGDEFYVVIDRAVDDDLDRFGRRLAAAVSHARERVCPDLMSTASFAIATLEPGENAEMLLAKADLALHESKCRAHRARGLRMTA